MEEDYRLKMPAYSRSVAPIDSKTAGLFDDCFRSEGGLLTNQQKYTNIDWYRLRYWDYLKKLQLNEFYGSGLTSTFWGFIDNFRLNAIALHHGSNDFIGIYAGSVANISFFFDMLLSHPEVFPYIGNVREEVPWLGDVSKCDWTSRFTEILLTIRPATGNRKDWPKHPDRKLTAKKLATLALDFLFFHEIGHIVYGHIEYEAKKKGGKGIRESEDGSLLPSIASQALELNADAFATSFITNEWYGAKWPNNTPFFGLLEVLTMWIVATGSLFLILDRSKSSISAYRNLSHPHPAIRLFHLWDASMGIANIHPTGSPETLEKAWELGLENLGIIWNITLVQIRF